MRPDLQTVLLDWRGKLYWSSVGTEGWLSGDPEGRAAASSWSLVDGDRDLEPDPLALSWERRSYCEKPRLSSVSQGQTNEEGETGREEEEEREEKECNG